MINIGTLFSGIGAFEEALAQLGIDYTIEFACDNGEIDFIPFENPTKRKEYSDLDKRAKNLKDEERDRYNELRQELDIIIDDLRNECNALPSVGDKIAFVDRLYTQYAGAHTNWVKKTYQQNHSAHGGVFYTDVRFVNGTDHTNQIDFLVGGSPCQSFSNYGKKRGLEDTRGTLFYDYARIIQESQPKVFIYENVESILTNDKGRTWATIQDVLRSLNYNIYSSVIDSVNHDHPQRRRRLFLVGFRSDLHVTNYVFPPDKDLTHFSDRYLETNPVASKYYLGKKGFEWITTPEKNENRTRVNQRIIGTQTANQQDNWIGDLRVERPRQEHYDDPKIYVGQYDFGNGLEDAVGRKLTPRECLKLMGFSPIFNIDGIPDKHLYRQSGNSIVVPVLKDIIQSIMPFLGNERED